MNIGSLIQGFKIWRIFQGALNQTKEASVNNQNQGKQWYQSLTIWANALMAVLTVVTPQIDQFVAGHPAVAAVIVAVSNLLLRLRTDKPVA